MVRITGVNIPDEKKIKISLTYLYGIGRKNAFLTLSQAQIDPEKRTKDLTSQELSRLQKVIDAFPLEGGLRKIVSENIKRLIQINAYRGLRHLANLPSRGQRTRSNARTKRGKRITVGALKKALAQKLETARKAKGKESVKE